MKDKKIKRKAQVKSSHYYLFWGVCTVAVVLGQLYVGTGYRYMYSGIQELLQRVDGILLRTDDPNTPKFY